jgi:hypothetical protein
MAAAAALIGTGGIAAAAPPPPGPHSGPVAGSRGQAMTLARALLELPALPSGTRPARHGQPVPPALATPPPPGRDTIGLSRLLVVPGKPASVQAYILAHGPRAALIGAGQGAGPGGPADWEADFLMNDPRPGIYQAELGFAMVRLTSTTTLVSEYTHVTWFPARSAAETLDAHRYHSITVTATILNPHTHKVTRTITSRAVINQFVALLNHLPTMPDVTIACPSSAVSNDIRFNGSPRADITTSGCPGEQVSVDGIGQPGLVDMPDKVSVLAGRVLGAKGPLWPAVAEQVEPAADGAEAHNPRSPERPGREPDAIGRRQVDQAEHIEGNHDQDGEKACYHDQRGCEPFHVATLRLACEQGTRTPI